MGVVAAINPPITCPIPSTTTPGRPQHTRMFAPALLYSYYYARWLDAPPAPRPKAPRAPFPLRPFDAQQRAHPPREPVRHVPPAGRDREPVPRRPVVCWSVEWDMCVWGGGEERRVSSCSLPAGSADQSRKPQATDPITYSTVAARSRQQRPQAASRSMASKNMSAWACMHCARAGGKRGDVCYVCFAAGRLGPPDANAATMPQLPMYAPGSPWPRRRRPGSRRRVAAAPPAETRRG